MRSHEIIRGCFGKKSPKELAAELGVSPSLVYKWAEPGSETGGSGAVNPLDRTRRLLELSQNEDILHWLCRTGGGFFVHDPAVPPNCETLTAEVNALVKRFADLLGAVASAASDHAISDAEAARLRTGWDELRSRTERFILACERGEFPTLAPTA